jgi:hypothetical protein
MADKRTHLDNSKSKRIGKIKQANNETTLLTGKSARLQHKTLHTEKLRKKGNQGY